MLDNLAGHMTGRIREFVEARGAELRFLPPYLPDFNSIEDASYKMKALQEGWSPHPRVAVGGSWPGGFGCHIRESGCAYRIGARTVRLDTCGSLFAR